MMNEKVQKFIEIEGDTVGAAIKKATDFLKVSKDKLSVKIVCEEKKGLFGMAGAKPAKIKVALKNCST